MIWKSYRSYSSDEVVSPFGGILAAMCIGLAIAAPWLALAYGIASAWRWLVG